MMQTRWRDKPLNPSSSGVRHKWIDGSGSEISKQPWGQRAHCEHFVPPQHGLFLFLLFNQSVPCSHPSLWSLALALSPHLIYAIVQFVLFAGSRKNKKIKKTHTQTETHTCVKHPAGVWESPHNGLLILGRCNGGDGPPKKQASLICHGVIYTMVT